MASKTAKRDELAERVADLLLAAGVAQIPLRDLAAELGTSDRMLLYYFVDKGELVQSSLRVVASRLGGMLEESVPGRRQSPGDMLGVLLDVLQSNEFRPVMNVWADIAARGGRAEAPFQEIAQSSVARWLAWLEQRLNLSDAKERQEAAVAILAIVEGARQLEAAAPGTTRRLGVTLASAFSHTSPRSTTIQQEPRRK